MEAVSVSRFVPDEIWTVPSFVVQSEPEQSAEAESYRVSTSNSDADGDCVGDKSAFVDVVSLVLEFPVVAAWSKPPLLEAAAALTKKDTASGARAKGESNMWGWKEKVKRRRKLIWDRVVELFLEMLALA